MVSRALLLQSILCICQAIAAPARPVRRYDGPCRQTTVAILGGGVAGITAAQALSNESFSDFLILEYQSEIGGRMRHAEFGSNIEGNPYIVELGANWVQGLGIEGGPENPIWTFAKQAKIANEYSNYSSIETFDENGPNDFSLLLDEFDQYWPVFEQDAGYILSENRQDRSMRAGLMKAGWKPKHDDMKAQAIEWWMWDWETSWSPDESSFVFGVAGYNLTFYQFSEENNFVTDQRGFNALLKHIASSFLEPNDPRLLLKTIVTDINQTDSGVTITASDGTCVQADYALCTFSLGVLQYGDITIKPKLPDWKQESIAAFQMGTYTKIFLQFNTTFWDTDTQFFLYASPTTRGYYPVWQSLSTKGFHPGSNILFVTIVGREAYRVENQDDETTMAEVLEVLRQMFPYKKIPKPISFMYPRWTKEPWALGSYSNWPVGTTLETHQNLRANVNRLYFAGEHTSTEYFGFLQGAWFEGREAGQRIARMMAGDCANTAGCGNYTNYEILEGTTTLDEYNASNGMRVSPFFVAAVPEG